MSTNTTVARFRIWPTFRTGLTVARRNASTILALALLSRFLMSQAVSGVTTFSNTTFGFDLAPFEAALVFLGSLVVMWFAVVPLTIQTIEDPAPIEGSGSLIERIWRNASIHYRALSLRTVLRGVGLLLINYAVVAVSMLCSAVAGFAIGRTITVGVDWINVVLLLIGLSSGLLVVLVSLRWSVALPAMIMEHLPIRESLRRSWYITKSQMGRLLGLGILIFAVVSVSGALVGGTFGILFVLYVGTSDVGSAVLSPFVVFGGQTIGLVFGAPITSASYYYLRGQRAE